jgi:hypothetical protein
MSVQDELVELAELLDGGTFHVIRERVTEGNWLRPVLGRFSARIYFFPVGRQPNLGEPIMVFLNGIVQMQDGDFQLQIVGTKRKLVVVVFDHDLSPLDTVQAQYENVPPPDLLEV